MWSDDTVEPEAWLTYNSPDDSLEPDSGSLLLVAHESAVEFGNVTINNLADLSAEPLAFDDAYSVAEDSILIVSSASGVLSNDIDELSPDNLTAALVSAPSFGTLANLTEAGSFNYEPNPDFFGTDSFVYRAIDGQNGASAEATVFLTVNPVNDAPLALDDAYATPPDMPLSIGIAGVLANDSDADLDPLDAVLVDDVMSGSLTLNLDGSFDYTPDPGFTGTDNFTYRASDSLLDSNLATVTILVQSPPTAVDDVYETDEDTALVVAASGVLSNDVDNEPPTDLTALLITGPSNGTLLSFSSDGGFTYVPDADFSGVDSFLYEAADAVTGATAEATVTLTVNAINDAPLAGDDSYTTAAETTLLRSGSRRCAGQRLRCRSRFAPGNPGR